ncbi:hypothetical protein COLO4_26573 [Corchorus olitorius]|uniref:hAT-like transposase RNase-H fold domain-containing protein n=1 Tax=Corchorus olitorius TaxID=93759 RepID=A0A1R3HWD9_9ROSI|nr:hypothetical protein COLO4_26573 [Corchorus olitorius]
MAKAMKEKYNKYWGQVDKNNMLVYVVAVMDPKKKMKFVTFCIKKMYAEENDQGSSLLASINEALLALFGDYRRRANPSSDKGCEPQSQGNVDDDLGAAYGGDAMA